MSVAWMIRRKDSLQAAGDVCSKLISSNGLDDETRSQFLILRAKLLYHQKDWSGSSSILSTVIGTALQCSPIRKAQALLLRSRCAGRLNDSAKSRDLQFQSATVCPSFLLVRERPLQIVSLVAASGFFLVGQTC
jgi:hypothetical protein